MMTEAKRPRGRPKGSEIDDRQLLSRVALLLVLGEAGNVAAGVRRLAGHDPSLIRRLQRKFQRDRDVLLAAARSTAEREARERETWMEEIERVTKPLDWHQAHDPAMRAMHALDREQRERLAKAFRRPTS